MKKKLVFAYLVCFALCSIFADNDDLLVGLDAYSRGDWTAAVESFEWVLTTAEPNDRTEALYWLVMSEASAQNYERALEYADVFLERSSEDERAVEVSYQKGRLLHLSGDYEASSDILYRFIEKYPDHPKIPSAYYWIGENLYATGDHTAARKIFNKVIVNYPQSGKVNEARYKIVLIDQQSVREELLRMANEAHAASAQVEEIPESIEPEPKSDEAGATIVSDSTDGSIEDTPVADEAVITVAEDTTDTTADAGKPDTTETAVASTDNTEAAAVEETAPLEEEEKQTEYFAGRLTALEEKINEISATLSLIVEEQENQRMREQQRQQEQREVERQQLEKRRQELAELKARTKTLEKLYEQRIKGVK